MYDITLHESLFPAQADAVLRDITVGHLLREIADIHSEAIALVDIDDTGIERQAWTYAELFDTSSRLALALATRFSPGEESWCGHPTSLNGSSWSTPAGWRVWFW